MIKVKEVQGRKVFEDIAEDHFYNFRRMHVAIRSVSPCKIAVVIRNSLSGIYEAINCSIDDVGFLVEGDFPAIYFCNIKDVNEFIERIVQNYLKS